MGNAHSNSSFSFSELSQYGEVSNFKDVKVLCLSFLNNTLPDKLVGINISCRANNKDNAEICDKLFHHRNDCDGEKIIFHLSADGTEVTAYTEKTGYVFFEKLCLLAMTIQFGRSLPVSVPYTFPMLADDMAESENGRLYRYYNCTLDDSDDNARCIAKKLDNLFVRDGICLSCVLAEYLSKEGISLSKAIKEIPNFYTTQRCISTGVTDNSFIADYSGPAKASGEGMVFQNKESRCIARPLKNGNGIMIFAESFKAESAAALCDEIENKLKLGEKDK